MTTYRSTRKKIKLFLPFPKFEHSKIVCSTKSKWLIGSDVQNGLLKDLGLQIDQYLLDQVDTVTLIKNWDAITQETWWEIKV